MTTKTFESSQDRAKFERDRARKAKDAMQKIVQDANSDAEVKEIDLK